MEPETQNWKLTLAYDGTDYKGWQVQPGARTVQGELQSALGRILGESPLPQGSGRTDAGVHALAQVASFPLRARIPADNLHRALNGTLPGSIRVTEARIVRSSFHARHSAEGKTYEYRIFRARICPPFLSRYVYATRWPMDFEALNLAAQAFLGTHNFLSFAASDPDMAAREALSAGETQAANEGLALRELRAAQEFSQATRGTDLMAHEAEFLSAEGKQTGAMRTVFSSQWEQHTAAEGPLLVYRIRGSGFLHHMVRNLVGTMLEVGRGRIGPEAIPEILAARSRSAAGPTAPGRGLFLHSVDYRAEDEALDSF